MRVTFKNSHFLIEGPGKAMDLITSWLAEHRAALARNKLLLDPLGVTTYQFDRDTGVVVGVKFDGDLPADWKKPNKHGISFPKKNSEWTKRLAAQVGHAKESDLIRTALQIPTIIWGKYADGKGTRREIGHWFRPCGFATLGAEPPFLLIIPDVAFYVAEAEADGVIVPDEVKSFKPEFEGCRPIAEREWEIMELQHKAAQAKATTV